MNLPLPGLAIALIVFQVLDAVACIGPIPQIKQSLDTIGCPEKIRKLLPFIKIDTALALTVGLFIPLIGLLACLALIGYFIVAIGFHVRVRDTVVNTIPSVVMLGFVAAVGVLSYLPEV